MTGEGPADAREEGLQCLIPAQSCEVALLNTHTRIIALVAACVGKEGLRSEPHPSPGNRMVVFTDLYGHRWDGVERSEERVAWRTHLAC